MMLEHLGEAEAASAVVRAIECILEDATYRTKDLGGSANTIECGKAIADAIA
jgi:tartrate dehydrogenase/decarboxylase/D-malate dehydrogenase